jgi:hypothetical protein
MNDRERFASVPAVHDYEGETIETRSSLRAANWTPALIGHQHDLAIPLGRTLKGALRLGRCVEPMSSNGMVLADRPC